MKREEFLIELNEMVQAEEDMIETTILESIDEWDSLALVSSLALFQRSFGFRPDLNSLHNAKTTADVLNLANGYYK